MPIIARIAAAVILAAVACWAPGVGADEQKLAPLPDVTVTAPSPPTPSWKKFTPFFGNPRVEEDKWPDIPCRDSRIAVASVVPSGPRARRNNAPSRTASRPSGDAHALWQTASIGYPSGSITKAA
jgi:hypothetical protein